MIESRLAGHSLFNMECWLVKYGLLKHLPGELMWIGSGKRAQKNGIKKYKSDTEAMFVNHRNLLLWISLDN